MTVERVQIICTDASHEDKRSIVETFNRTPDGWRSAPGHKLRRPGKLGTVATVARSTAVDLDAADTPMPAYDAPQPPVARTRYNLRCKLCDRRPVSVRAERLDPILDRLADNGLSAITLPALAARLR